MRHSMDYVDAVAGDLRLGNIHFGLDYCLNAKREIGHGDLFFHAVIHTVNRAVVITGEMEHRFAHGLGGNGAGVDAHASHDGPRFHDHHALLHLGSGHGGALPGWPGADDDQIVFDGAHASLPLPKKLIRFGRGVSNRTPANAYIRSLP